MMELDLQLFGGRGSSGGGGGGGAKASEEQNQYGGGGAVTPTSIPNRSVENIQKFVDQFGTGITVEQMVQKVYTALPNTGTFRGMGGIVGDKGASIVNGRYLQIDGGPTLQFIKQKSKGSWKVNKIGG